MQIWSTNSGWFQIFKYEGEHFINWTNGKALDVHGGKDEEGRRVIVWNKHNGKNQKWNVVYLDKAKKEPTKGLDKDFGFHINRPFYIRSRMLFKRVVELVGAHNIVLKRYAKGRIEQQFYFDGQTHTIKSNRYKDRSLDIQNHGNHRNLRMTSTNARWW
jgi:hypothetical protein